VSKVLTRHLAAHVQVLSLRLLPQPCMRILQCKQADSYYPVDLSWINVTVLEERRVMRVGRAEIASQDRLL
jgi:hypothetical protein